MINPLKVATAGYLKRNTKAVLIIAVAGYLNFGGVPPPSPGTGGDGVYYQSKQKQEQQERNRRNKIIREDKELIEILKIWLQKCQ